MTGEKGSPLKTQFSKFALLKIGARAPFCLTKDRGKEKIKSLPLSTTTTSIGKSVVVEGSREDRKVVL